MKITDKWVIVNLEPDGLPMVTVWSTRELAVANAFAQYQGGPSGKTITLLCRVEEILQPVPARL